MGESRGGGQSEELDLVVVLNWGASVIYLHAKWLRGEVSRGSFLSPSVLVLPAFLPHLPPAPRLSAEVSALLLEPPVPASFSSPRATSSLFLLRFAASCPPRLLSWGF